MANEYLDDTQLIEPDCWDTCCRPHRHPDEFDLEGKQVLDNRDVVDLMTYNQVGIVTLLIISFVIIAVWSCFSIVSGFSKYDGTDPGLNVVSHTGWWLAIDIFVLLIGGMSIFLAFNLSRREEIEISIHKMNGWLILFAIILGLGIISNIFHGVLSARELHYCTSSLCLTNKAFLNTLLGMLGALVLLKAWSIYRVLTYNSNMSYAFGLVEDRDVTLRKKPQRKEMVEEDREENVAKRVQFTTPVQQNSRHGFKSK